MKSLEQLIAKKREELRELQMEINGMEKALQHISGSAPQPKQRAARSDVKKQVLTLLEKQGKAGLNAATAVEMAAKQGYRLERGTVSSLLSRLKGDRTVSYDGSVYRLKEFGDDPNSDSHNEKAEASVHPFPASKSAP